MSSRIIIVSNRLPLKISPDNFYTVKRSEGGLATGIASLNTHKEVHWVGWPGITPESEEEKDQIRKLIDSEKNIHPVFYDSEEQYLNFYEGFSNSTLWPLFHYFLEYAKFNEEYWQSYVEVNKLFCKELLSLGLNSDVIWIHDYHLMLLPQMLRKELPHARIGFFLHIPFPSYEIFRILPWRKELLRGVLGADLIGFHTYDYMRHFDSAIYRITGREVTLGQLQLNRRLVSIDTFPMGIDYDKFSEATKSKEVKVHAERFRKQMGDVKLILSVDRLDYSKGITHRLEAIDLFFREFPYYREKVSFVQLIVPSRDEVNQYKLMKEEIDEKIGQINGAYSTFNWQPIHYFYRSVEFNELVALYHTSDICLVTSLRDGMNLVSKEYVASNDKGILILSELAGSSIELNEALIINPNNIKEIIQSLDKALQMNSEEQEFRIKKMQEKIRRRNVNKWAANFLNTLEENIRERKQRGSKSLDKEKILSRYQSSEKRLMFFDYDGTLTGFHKDPQAATPDLQLLEILEDLSTNPKNQVVIISGRDSETLVKWLGHLNVDLIAEHGVCTRKEGEWNKLSSIDISWKVVVRSIMQKIMDKTPGSFIEEKPYSLVWHYRASDTGLATIRHQELLTALLERVQEENLALLNGKKVVEVKLADIDKGKAAQTWMADDNYDFIMAAGDDQTDEYLFRTLPDHAWTVKIGVEATDAQFFLRDYKELRELLARF